MIGLPDQQSAPAIRSIATLRYLPVADYGEARIACLGWLYEAARNKGTGEDFVKQLRLAKDKSRAPSNGRFGIGTIFCSLRGEGKQMLPTAMILAPGSRPVRTACLRECSRNAGKQCQSRLFSFVGLEPCCQQHGSDTAIDRGATRAASGNLPKAAADETKLGDAPRPCKR